VPKPLLGKVLRVYLVDPRTTWTPVDTPFRLTDHGVHCGFEHGNSVWIKYIARAPKFTAKEWSADFTYKKSALVYSPDSGECYESKANGNIGHDPIQTSESESPNVLTTEITQEFAPANPGLADTEQKMNILAAPGTTFGTPGTALADPAPVGQTFTIKISDAGGTFLGDATATGDGATSLLDLFTSLVSQLLAEPLLSTFTISVMGSGGPPVGIHLEDLSAFQVSQATYQPYAGAEFPLAVQQIQTYAAATPPTPATPKQVRLSINISQVLPGETYHLCFVSLDGNEHDVEYVSAGTDGAEQILTGLASAIVALQGADTFFTGIQSTFDPLSPSLTFTVAPTLAKASLDAVIRPPGSIWWSYIPFPLALVDEVVRGAYSDCLRGGGQPDKAEPEEAKVPTETSIKVDGFASKQFDGITDQQVARSRYGRGEK
jgi:hypothetical protein